MMEKATKQFEELCKVENIEQRIKIACEMFNKEEISAKAIRILFNYLDTNMKIVLLNNLYATNVRKNNMRRLPPHILAPKTVVVSNEAEFELWGTLIKYNLINNYNSSKIQNKFERLKKIININAGNPIMKIYNTSYESQFGKKAINSYAIQGFIDELVNTENNLDTSPLSLPSAMTIGVEIEFVGINYQEFKKIAKELSYYGVDFLEDFQIKYDTSVKKSKEYGTELVSPILEDTKEDWEKLKKALIFIKTMGGKTNKTCGGHIHIGSNILGVDKKAWETFLKIWAEAEPLMYMISNRRAEKSRAKISTYGKMIDQDIRNQNWSTIKIKNEDDVINMVRNINQYRYHSLNLTNIGNYKKDTIEFRLSNGSIDYNIWRENILLYGRMVQFAKIYSIDPNRKKEEFEKFFENGLTEKEKIKRFLNLIFDSEQEKEIFYKRWESRAGEAPIFGETSISTYKRQTYPEIRKTNIDKRIDLP